eukprot:CAMPEP_0197641218 /NCGR_PEP_ID=MMETSP1338-20131121/15247_1 /TAXON_ID=43686 ORGANISM="Pelagodinium beii, Strain RCC1491" /NCGR_SAMPLE_ID=MMETSP1338 /ASSEMBLY_ACC=CAM_ASM_000754 /LENGTH=410 /DNA_ID=CAMNT_0043214161 /DNA_START=481 /DNA_END=1713 /DNA_ORIENTATION=+
MWAVLAVEFLNEPIQQLHADNPTCKDIFSSMGNASIWLFQTLVAGDSFGMCSVPLMREQPASTLIFVAALVTIQLGFTNLILAAIVGKAADARAGDKEEQAREVQRGRDAAVERFSSMCAEMDVDQNGRLSLTELMHAFHEHSEFRACLTILGIDDDRLAHQLFELMDEDGSGDVSYDELTVCLHRSENNDLKRQIMMLKLRVEDIFRRVSQKVRLESGERFSEFENMGQIPPAIGRSSDLQPPKVSSAVDTVRTSTQPASKLSQELPKAGPKELPKAGPSLDKVQQQFQKHLEASQLQLSACLENLRQQVQKDFEFFAPADAEKEDLEQLRNWALSRPAAVGHSSSYLQEKEEQLSEGSFLQKLVPGKEARPRKNSPKKRLKKTKKAGLDDMNRPADLRHFPDSLVEGA